MEPELNMKGCEDFFLIILHAHIIAAAKKIMQKQKYDKVKDLANAILSKYVNFNPDEKVPRGDKINLYATQTLTLGLIWHSFNDSIYEGDGDRVLACWKFMLVIFKAKGYRNYCKEAIILLAQYHCLLSERKAAQLKWCRFVNTSGRAGNNVPCDLHLEHLNRRLKGLITNLCSNAAKRTENDEHSMYPNNSVNRAARSIGVLHEICNTSENQTGVGLTSGNHNRLSLVKDVEMVVKVLEDEKIFDTIRGGRKHHCFKNLNTVLQQCPSKQLKKWISGKLKTYKIKT